VVLVIVGGLSALTGAPRPTAPAGSSHVTAAAPPFTHGDLVVTPGETFVIQPTPGSRTYYQGGNITVDNGGTLLILNVTLSFVQFVSDTGTPMQRLSHIDRFVDMGTVTLTNSTLTTDVQVINAWAKLNVTVEGDMTAQNSTFAFPGWLNVEGSSGDLTLNDSRVTGNPAIEALSEPLPILGDTQFAPSISVTGGAELNVFNSSLSDTYADNTVGYGHPQPVPLGLPHNPLLTPLGLGTNNFSHLSTPTDSANLTQDWLYPNANFQAGNLIMDWNNPSKTAASVNAYVWYDGVEYTVATGLFFQNFSSGEFYLPLPANLLQTITHHGVLNYLNWTGDFSGESVSRIAIDFVVVSGPAVVNASADFSLLPTPDYDMSVSGAGSTLNSIDSSFALNWNARPANATSQAPPFPWNSNKLLLTAGAVAYLANVTVTSALPGVFSTSAVLPDAASEAYFYRWAQFNLTGRGGFLAISGAQVSAYYAYSTNQTDNQTANALNDLATANPEIWGYVQYWDAQHGVAAYGQSNVSGVASVLLASSNVTNATLPDGFFLGGYHIGVVVPAVGVGSHWFNWSVSPYPEGVAVQPPAVAGPDFGPPQRFSQYFAGVVIASTTVLANGVASTTVNLGQKLGVKLVLEDIGTAPITQVSGQLLYDDSGLPSALLASYENTSLDLVAPGQNATFTLAWFVTENVTGLHPAFEHNLTVVLDWNHNNVRLAGGNLSENVSVTFEPTLVNLESVTLLANGVASATVSLGQTLGVEVVASVVGNATISAISAWLYYNDSGLPTALLASFTNTSLDLSGSDPSVTFTLLWKATENVTGLHGWFDHNLTLALTWNDNTNSRWLGNGSLAQNVSVKFAPSEIQFVWFSLPPQTLDLTVQYVSTVFLAYNGSQSAVIELFATPVGGGLPIEIASMSNLSGNFSMTWATPDQLQALLTPGTSYTLTATAIYNSRETNDTLPGTYTVPPTPSSSTNFFLQKFLGLPLWVWLAIAAAAAIAIVLFLFVVRRQAAGKLVECGECGNLIPEDATVCPKCGAEFESDLIRCSRCASTIPADSKFCPECAAQLLGTPGEAASDPEKQAYADFTEKYRAEGKRELGDNYSEGAFWDWWKRQPTYTPFSQWSLQQGQGTARVGMTAPPIGTETTPEPDAGRMPPKKGGPGWVEGPSEGATAPAAPNPATPAPAGAGLKACPSCGKEIPSEYLVCPFCNAVTS
jgi:RNA polymerase subunit RPABC4/transcription elongation factor Spt4